MKIRHAARVVVAPLAVVMLLSGIATAAVSRVTKSSLPARTARDAQMLQARELAVVAALAAFQHLPQEAQLAPWEHQLAAAESAQAKALATVSTDIGSPPAKKPTTVKPSTTTTSTTTTLPPAQSGPIYSTNGVGNSTTATFTVAPNASGWMLQWSYDCSNLSVDTGNFIATIRKSDGSTTDIGPNEVGAFGADFTSYSDTGTFYLVIYSQCSWTVTIDQD